MNFEHNDKTKELIDLVGNFIVEKIRPREEEYSLEMKAFRDEGNPWHCLLYTSPSPRD